MIWRILSYPRAVIMAILYPFFIIAIAGLCVLQNMIFNRRTWDDWFMQTWATVSLRLFGVHVRVQGLQNIPPGGCLFVFNHTSFFDIFAMGAVLPHIRFGAKIELFRIPIFGFAMRRIGILPIDRGAKEKVFEVYQAAQKKMAAGEKFALAPEGTRQEQEILGPFKSGPFVFAINTQAPLVPVVIRGASEILPKKALFPNWGVWRREIDLIVLPAISTSGYSLAQRPQLQQELREKMLPYFQKNI